MRRAKGRPQSGSVGPRGRGHHRRNPTGRGQDRAARAIAGMLGDGVKVTNLPGRGGGNAWDRLVGAPGAADLAVVSSPTLAEIAGHLEAPVSSLPIHVFESAPQALADVVGGEADVAVVSVASAIAGVVESALAAVLVTSPVRLGGVSAATPTCVELGIPCVRGTWRGLVGPPGLDRTSIDAWSHGLASAVATERWSRLLEENFWVDSHAGPDESMVFMEAERIELGRLLGRLDLVGDG